MTIRNLTQWLSSRERRQPCTTIVFHATAGASAASSVSWLRQIGLSYHYVIDRDGSITKAVPVGRAANHAGKSVGPDGPWVNRYSIGIAFANLDDGKDPITDEQFSSARILVKQLEQSMPTLKWVTTHKRISPGRKVDPRLFDALSFVRLLGKTRLAHW